MEFHIINNFLSEEEIDDIFDFSITNLKLLEAKISDLDDISNYRKSNVSFFNYFDKYPFLKERYEIQINNFFNIKGFDIDFESMLQFTEYKDSGFYEWHTDSNPTNQLTSKRFCSTVLLLNDDYNGGELEIIDSEDKKYILEKKKGNLFIFPSQLRHRVTKLLSGKRYSLVGWFSLKDKKNFKKTLL